MKKNKLQWLMFLMVGLVLSSLIISKGSAAAQGYLQSSRSFMREQIVAPTLIPTVTPSYSVTATSETRVLPPVGSNAGLVIGASVLVLIIIGGVILSVRLKTKH